MDEKTLRTRQEALADDALASYNFGEGVTVVESDAWQRDTFDGKDDLTRVVYVQYEDDPPDADSHRISFHAAFEQGTLTLKEAYAYACDNGAEIGFQGERQQVEEDSRAESRRPAI